MPTNEDQYDIPIYKPKEDIFLSLVHVALKLRGDILSQPNHKGFNVNDKEVKEFIPDNVLIFLKILYEGPSILEDEYSDEAPEDHLTNNRILSVGQDLVFGVSKAELLNLREPGNLVPRHIFYCSRHFFQNFNVIHNSI